MLTLRKTAIVILVGGIFVSAIWIVMESAGAHSSALTVAMGTCFALGLLITAASGIVDADLMLRPLRSRRQSRRSLIARIGVGAAVLTLVAVAAGFGEIAIPDVLGLTTILIGGELVMLFHWLDDVPRALAEREGPSPPDHDEPR